jgi:hypothetical protein
LFGVSIALHSDLPGGVVDLAKIGGREFERSRAEAITTLSRIGESAVSEFAFPHF